jgi:uncharacterized protein (TIGR03435 family)
MRLALGVLAVAGVGMAQPAASFEVASIKLHPPPITFASGPFIRGSRVTATALTLRDLIGEAYGVRFDAIAGGPAWLLSDHYDIEAKAEGDATLTKEQEQSMLQALLADRFQLKVHRETREVPIYALVVGKNGSKMKQSSADAPGNNFVRAGPGGLHMEATKGTMDKLATQLAVTAGRPVVDKTGLAGYYAFTLDWAAGNSIPDADSNTPSMFTAVQEQLGLKLEAATGPIEMVIIDRAEKPSGN